MTSCPAFLALAWRAPSLTNHQNGAWALALGAVAARVRRSGSWWLVALVLATLAWPAAAVAQDLSGRYVVSRKAPNVYAAQNQSLLFLTDDCNVFVYGEPARLSGFLGGRMIEFERDSSPRCDVMAVMQRSRVKAGRYQVRVLSDVDDWYAVDNSELRIRTLGCQRLADLDPAVLFLGADGAGVVEFMTGNACSVEGVYLPWRASSGAKKGRGESRPVKPPARRATAEGR